MSLTLALILDAIFGEPRSIWTRIPHPAVLMGRAVGAADARLNTGNHKRAKGVVTIALLNAAMIALGLLLTLLPGYYAEAIIGAVLLAQRSLADHVRDVGKALADGLPAGRKAVAQIVGRDTADMDEPAIARAAVESAAENFSDGVVAPAFWLALAGLPGLLVYKMTNTADSMIGHRSDQYRDFGWAAARLDDLLNLIPARLSALILMIAGRKRGAWQYIRRDAPLHRSPNAGWPEAAMAVALDMSLAGPRAYDGVTQDFPWVYPEGRRDTGAGDIHASVRMLWRGWVIVVILSLLSWLV